MRAAVYARFSSELQDARSITDQVALCRARAEAEGWSVSAEYSDAAISGAAMVNRPGLKALMAAASARKFDIVLTESLDRLSRDLADIAALWRDLSFWGLRVVTLGDGEVNFMHVGLKGIVGQMFLADLAAKTRRGHIGRLRDGKIPGGKCYGYDVAAGDKGVRVINEGEAGVVRRIFELYDSGRSARDIAATFNAEGIPAPNGGAWASSTINGSAKRASGILQNRLYAGEIIYGRQRFEKNPATGKRIGKWIDPKDWLVQPAPQLAIVGRDIFDRVQAQRANRTLGRKEHQRRPKHLFSGITVCGCCGGTMIVVKPGRIGCSHFRNRGTCRNSRTITFAEIESRVLGVLQEFLLAPDVVAAAVEAYRSERERLANSRASAAREVAKNLAAVEGKIERLIRAIETGVASPAMAARVAELEAERERLRQLAPAPIADNVLALHPAAATRYRDKVAGIHEALSKGDAAAREAIALVRELISAITVTPDENGGHGLALDGNLAAMLSDGARMTTDGASSRYHILACVFRLACREPAGRPGAYHIARASSRARKIRFPLDQFDAQPLRPGQAWYGAVAWYVFETNITVVAARINQCQE